MSYNFVNWSRDSKTTALTGCGFILVITDLKPDWLLPAKWRKKSCAVHTFERLQQPLDPSPIWLKLWQKKQMYANRNRQEKLLKLEKWDLKTLHSHHHVLWHKLKTKVWLLILKPRQPQCGSLENTLPKAPVSQSAIGSQSHKSGTLGIFELSFVSLDWDNFSLFFGLSLTYFVVQWQIGRTDQDWFGLPAGSAESGVEGIQGSSGGKTNNSGGGTGGAVATTGAAGAQLGSALVHPRVAAVHPGNALVDGRRARHPGRENHIRSWECMLTGLVERRH